MDLTGVLPISESGAERLAEGDHIGEDGLVYCGKCGSRKQLQNPLFMVGAGVKLAPFLMQRKKVEE